LNIRWLDEEYPSSDDVNEYIQGKPMHIPFKDVLFGTATIAATDRVPIQRNTVLTGAMRKVTTPNYALYTGID
jgi:hypothetical protein